MMLDRFMCSRTRVLVLFALMLTAIRPVAGADMHTLRFYFIDVEGGAATLIVTPAGESILIDSGNPGDRDSGLIAAAARDAGVGQIDHYITTHWHDDHVGGAWPLSKLLPIRHVYGHTIPDPLPADINKNLIDAWRGVSSEPIWLAAGDRIKLKGARGTPTPRLRVVAANGLVAGEHDGAPQVTTCQDGTEARAEDTTDNARSVATVLTFGKFDVFVGGDLTWNVEHKLTCPKRIARPVDVYVVDHHGLDLSNNPAFVSALSPEVAIVNNGARKGAEEQTMALLLKQVGDVGVFQLHRNVREGAINAESARIANPDEACNGSRIELTVAPDGNSYSVDVPSRTTTRKYYSR
jgi:beta-lactamase superfamily II metal-dependent hydrolase